MISFFRRLFGLCEHKWAVLDKYDVVKYRGAVPHRTQYILRCEKCGAMKNKVF